MQTGNASRIRPRSVGVIGGGTSGYFAALALKRRFPEMAVTVVESADIPIIGVGEATTTLMPPFLHGQLGLDPVELFRCVKPTFKLGIKFEWGLPDPEYAFAWPFGDADPVEAFAFERDLRNQSVLSMLMATDRAPVTRGPDGQIVSLLSRLKFAYHLDNAPFVALLARVAAERGILHETMTITAVTLRDDDAGIDAVRSADGRELRFDFYIDASGFGARLIEGALGSPFQSFASSLFCDRAIVATVPQAGPVRPYTTAETMDAGWCWRIPVVGEDHRGYVHASAFLSEEKAIEEMRAKNPGMGEPWIVNFRSGRHRDFWRGNTVAMGNAYGFVEPLESTALHMVIIEIAYLLAGLEAMGTEGGGAGEGTDGEKLRAFANDSVGAHWDFIRWFLSIHYKFNRRLETTFWKAARADVDSSGLDGLVERFRREGPWLASDGKEYGAGDPAFGINGVLMMLLGQHVDFPVTPRAGATAASWSERVAKQQRVVDWALPQREALEVLAADPSLLTAFATAKTSWCVDDAQRVLVPPADPRTAPAKGGPSAGPGWNEEHFRGLRR